MSLPSDTDILVVGAGPTGLAAAISLKLHGFRTVIVDALAQGQNTSRAAVIHAYTLEVLEALGCTERLVNSGIKSTGGKIYESGKLTAFLEFERLPTEYPYALLISQADTERILLERLIELGGEVLRSKRAVGMKQLDDQIEVSFESGEIVKSRYVIGADGLHSVIRSLAGISFLHPSAKSEEDHANASILQLTLGDVTYKSSVMPNDGLAGFVSSDGLLVWIPLPSGDARIVATVPDNETPPKVPSVEYLQKMVDARTYRKPNETIIESVIWGSRFRVRSAIAGKAFIPLPNSKIRGGTIIIGDAAHVHSPAGGQGMNMGLCDGVLLGPVLKKHWSATDDQVIHQYEQERRKVWLEVINMAEGMTRLASTAQGWRASLAAWILWGITKVPWVRQQMAMRVSGLVYRQ
ncbi:hypothetical protein FRC03_001209 [Tulasnella sp. 419]|nr:hypothetical protein FRC03_001209 [Tulasnella sp. 419]